MKPTIYDTLSESNKHQIMCSTGEYYISDIDMSIHRSRDSLKVTYMKNAMAKGKKCMCISISNSFGNEWDCLNPILREFESKIETFRLMAEIDGKEYGTVYKNEIMTVRYDYEKSSRVFHPVRYKEHLKPVKELPGKLTLSHIYRIIANGQFEKLKCNGIYTDDYAYDAACNYNQGEIAESVLFLSKIYEHPSGWWCSSIPEKDNRVSVCCHNFNRNSLIINLNKNQ